jgi:predicted small secreted protein
MTLQSIARVFVALATLAPILLSSACNTVEGMGKDLKTGGTAIENAATRAKK